MSGITIPRVLVAVRVGGAIRVGSGKLPNRIHIHAWFICLLLWLRWSGLSLSAWQSHRRFISVSVGVGEEGMSSLLTESPIDRNTRLKDLLSHELS